jgi:AcrR family transcriptional regulator
MSEVARDAKVSKALIFWHFRTKEELFLAVLNRLLEPYFIDFAEEVGALDERAQLRKLVHSYLLFVRDNAPSVRFFLGQLLHGEKVPEELATQVMKLYAGYRQLMIDIVRRAQDKNLCLRNVAPEAAAGFMVSALNGSLVGFLFTGGTADELDQAVTMLEEWLFRDSAPRSTEGGKAVA